MKFNVVRGDTAENENDPGVSQKTIQDMIRSSPIFLFMKGTPEAPQCGFSYRVCDVLKKWEAPFESFNVLSNETIRQGVKDFSNWPTIPQVYVNQEFIGGCDIVEELSTTGELLGILKQAHPEKDFTPPPPPAQPKAITPQEALEIKKDLPNARILDVRSPEEWEITHINNSELVNQDLVNEILSQADYQRPLLCLCHHGMRSADAARFFASEGFQRVYNIMGGIDRWAKEVDSSIERY